MGQLIMHTKNFDSSILAISIVSHGQGWLVRSLLDDLEPLVASGAQILVTLNIPEDENFLHGIHEGLTLIRNSHPKGFGENHNQAFMLSNRDWFAVINPDVRCKPEVFPRLLEAFTEENISIVAPLVVNPHGTSEDSVRRFPTLGRIFLRLVWRCLKRRLSSDYVVGPEASLNVDWVAGIFMLFKSDLYREAGGFDERYFMYLEDADICRRMHQKKLKVLVQPSSVIVHDARRASNKNFRYLKWHIFSLIRYLFITPLVRPPSPLRPPKC